MLDRWENYFSQFLIVHSVSVVSWGTMLRAGRSRVSVPLEPMNVFNLPNPSNSTMALELTQPVTEIRTRKHFWGVERGRRVRLTTSSQSVSRLSRQCKILSLSLSLSLYISQLYRHPRSVMGTAFLT
jgi:hypothetical protein